MASPFAQAFGDAVSSIPGLSDFNKVPLTRDDATGQQSYYDPGTGQTWQEQSGYTGPDNPALDAGSTSAPPEPALSIPWWVYGVAGTLLLIVLLHELAPEVGLLTAIRKGS